MYIYTHFRVCRRGERRPNPGIHWLRKLAASVRESEVEFESARRLGSVYSRKLSAQAEKQYRTAKARREAKSSGCDVHTHAHAHESM